MLLHFRKRLLAPDFIVGRKPGTFKRGADFQVAGPEKP